MESGEKMKLQEIIERVVYASEVPEWQIKGLGRSPDVVAAKALFIRVANKTGYTDVDIAKFLGRGHPAVNHLRNHYKESIYYKIFKHNYEESFNNRYNTD